MNRILLSIILLIALFVLLGCGAASPEEAARMVHEYGQQYEAEMQRIEREGLESEESNMPEGFGYIITLIIGLALGASAQKLMSYHYKENDHD